MALGTYTDMAIVETEFHEGFVEGIAQNIADFRTLVQDAIVFDERRIPGHTDTNIMFKTFDGFVTRRDIAAANNTLTSANDINKIEELQMDSVKVNRKLKWSQTADAFKKSLQSSFSDSLEDMAAYFGRNMYEAYFKDQINSALLSITTVLYNASYDSGTTQSNKHVAATTLTSNDLIAARNKLGDHMGSLRLWVMTAESYNQLVKEQITQNYFSASSFNLFQGIPATMGLPVLVTDDPALLPTTPGASTTAGKFKALGLTAGAVTVTSSEEDTFDMQRENAGENLVVESTLEFAYNLRVRGATYQGSTNPTAAQLGAKASWLDSNDAPVATSYKNLGGVVIEHSASA